MNFEDIKVGETYNVRVKVISVEYGAIETKTIDAPGNPLTHCVTEFLKSEAAAFSHLAAPPKHDPTRLFKKGDKVRVVEWNGRHFHDRDYGVDIETGCVARIYESEKDDPKKCAVKVSYRQYLFTVPTCFLELVTPVEKLEPYSVKETMSHDGWQIVRDGLPLAIYDSQRHPNAKAAAEAECDRLNAEWRKEQNNV